MCLTVEFTFKTFGSETLIQDKTWITLNPVMNKHREQAGQLNDKLLFLAGCVTIILRRKSVLVENMFGSGQFSL